MIPDEEKIEGIKGWLDTYNKKTFHEKIKEIMIDNIKDMQNEEIKISEEDIVEDLISIQNKLKDFIKQNMDNAYKNINDYLGQNTYFSKEFMIENYEAEIENINNSLVLIRNINEFIKIFN